MNDNGDDDDDSNSNSLLLLRSSEQLMSCVTLTFPSSQLSNILRMFISCCIKTKIISISLLSVYSHDARYSMLRKSCAILVCCFYAVTPVHFQVELHMPAKATHVLLFFCCRIEATLTSLGWRKIEDKMDESFKLKWVECKSQINYDSFREGERWFPVSSSPEFNRTVLFGFEFSSADGTK